ncbi:hypothetical protein TNIN_294561 [Trichonephila inaurata madagascariensis]|uniref:Uncharacterized protein n=1 Tax=Trichonephila inaurata madagascariensis TaxID=2747483 RepID=A0A8X7C7K8_9ARAC|nr:hypothetical protein TNIN_294561 [Trichonephila inaurata madagascariensis]
MSSLIERKVPTVAHVGIHAPSPHTSEENEKLVLCCKEIGTYFETSPRVVRSPPLSSLHATFLFLPPSGRRFFFQLLRLAGWNNRLERHLTSIKIS